MIEGADVSRFERALKSGNMEQLDQARIELEQTRSSKVLALTTALDRIERHELDRTYTLRGHVISENGKQ